MFAFLANLFGYVLSFLYNIVNNFGLAIILFCIIIKIAMIPISISQQKSLKKNAKIQEKMKDIQKKYKNNPEKLNQETMKLYKTEKMNPLSGCFSAIIQMILLLAVFYMIKSPLTYMEKVDTSLIDNCINTLQTAELIENVAYPELEVIKNIDKLAELIPDKAEEIQGLFLNMNFLGIDLNQVPTQNTSDFKVYIIPVLYVVVSFISMKITMVTQPKVKKKEDIIIENADDKAIQTKEPESFDMAAQMNKNMTYMFPIMFLIVAIITPLGLALYWLVNSLLMIIERLIFNKVLKDEEEEQDAK